MSNGSSGSGPLGFLSGIFSTIGQSLNQQTQAAADAATQAFYVIAGELAVVIVLLVGIFLSMAGRRR